jgi:diguanylate cyclase (GGDEF)-like protein/PAS domain S-box-containing protein
MNEPVQDRAPETVRILLADDDRRLLESLRGLLDIHGYRADTAPGGREAMEMLRSGDYDLLLLDLSMPQVSGHQVLRFMAEQDVDTLAVVVSGNSSLDDVSGALRAGAYDYLKKPYVPEELLATVKNAIQKKLLEDTNRRMRGRLERSERLHRVIVNNSPDIVFILDEQGRFSFINDSARHLLGYEQNELMGTAILDLVEAEDREKARYFFGQAGQVHNDVRSVELALRPRTVSRSRRYFELAVWPTHDGPSHHPELVGHHVYGTARDITDRKESEAFINFQAYHDLLTRLPNRALFKDRVSVAITQANRNDVALAVMFIDLNRFKVINDTLGHTVGDRLLQLVAQRLQGCIRKGDTLSRFGGDEFTLLLPEVTDAQAAIQVAEKILESLAQPFRLAEHELYVGASIGIALYPEGGDSLEALIKNADIAMYREKRSGNNGVLLFSPEMGGNSHRLHMEQDLRRALDRREFVVLYQPQIDAETEQMVGVEALVRWNHPTQGQLAPADFIPLAEDTRLIVELDRATLESAITEVLACHAQGLDTLRLAVNLSPILVERDDFVEVVLDTLERTGFPPELLELELTESLLMSDTHDTVEKLKRLCAIGVRIAIDDFGTGYSSLSYLQKLPVHTLKIDRSFTRAISSRDNEACIVNAIVAMARGMNMDIVTEGVENAIQRDYLRRLGCPLMQGYLFGEPTTLSRLVHGETAGVPV